MKKTSYNRLFDVERRIREIRTLHSMEKISTKQAKLMLNDLSIEFESLLSQLPQEQREFFVRNRSHSF